MGKAGCCWESHVIDLSAGRWLAEPLPHTHAHKALWLVLLLCRDGRNWLIEGRRATVPCEWCSLSILHILTVASRWSTDAL